MFCRDCHRYDTEEGKCRDRKVNPRTWNEAVDVANYLGIRSICIFNDYRERLVHSRGNAARPTSPASRRAR
jgi:hypothetical protein